MGEDCVELLSRMMSKSPTDRITAIEALHHPFILTNTKWVTNLARVGKQTAGSAASNTPAPQESNNSSTATTVIYPLGQLTHKTSDNDAAAPAPVSS